MSSMPNAGPVQVDHEPVESVITLYNGKKIEIDRCAYCGHHVATLFRLDFTDFTMAGDIIRLHLAHGPVLHFDLFSKYDEDTLVFNEDCKYRECGCLKPWPSSIR